MAVASCENNIDRIIKHQDEIIALGRSKEIINDNERSFYMLTTYRFEKNEKNEYFFKKEEKRGGKYFTLYSEIQFNFLQTT